jgi:DsbC/DsbD-like thiol-disulfide interchange protein
MISMNPARVIGIILSLFSVAGLAAENPLRIELVAESTGIQPGRPFLVGLRLQHPAGYHTYWKFPGIVGVPTDIRWDLLRGWKVDPIQWPAPERVFMFQIKAQGFRGEKLLPIRITPPANLAPGQTVTLTGNAAWMCCGRECHPGFGKLSITLPVIADAPAPDRRWARLFAESLADVPEPSRDWAVKAVRDRGEITLRMTPVSDGARQQLKRIREVTFFTEDGWIDPNKPESIAITAGEIVLTQTISEHAPKRTARRIAGILHTPQAWLPDGKPKAIRIAVPLRE